MTPRHETTNRSQPKDAVMVIKQATNLGATRFALSIIQWAVGPCPGAGLCSVRVTAVGYVVEGDGMRRGSIAVVGWGRPIGWRW